MMLEQPYLCISADTLYISVSLIIITLFTRFHLACLEAALSHVTSGLVLLSGVETDMVCVPVVLFVKPRPPAIPTIPY